MSNDKLFTILNGYMLHYGIDSMDGLMERREEPDRRYLAKTTTRSEFISIAYIVKSIKNQRANPMK